MDYEIYVSRERSGLGHNRAAVLVKQAAARALQAEGVDKALVSVMLTDEEGIRRVNREFRGVDSVTDVLSFPLNELSPGAFRAEDCRHEQAQRLSARLSSRKRESSFFMFPP